VVSGHQILSNRFEEQQERGEALANRQGLTLEELTAMQERLKRFGKIMGDLSESDVSASVISGEALRPAASLPGYGAIVSAELRQKAKASTVQIGTQSKGAADKSTWYQNCTATKMTYQARTFVLSAAHCFADDIPKHGGPEDAVMLPRAVNITSKATESYAILDPTIPEHQRMSAEPLAFVTNIAINRSGDADWALLEVSQNEDSDRAFGDIPGLNLQNTASGYSDIIPKPPVEGQNTVVYSIPQSSGNTEIMEPGTYLGRVYGGEIGYSSSYLYDLVGINPEDPTEDACNYGASGSQAVLADGTTTGPLAWRNNIGYPNGTREPVDGTAQHTRTDRLKIEATTGINSDQFSTVCIYSAAQPDTIGSLIKVLDDPDKAIYPDSMK
jgi:hypothetical protein